MTGFAWPAAVLIIVLVVIFTFRKQFSELISRTKKVSSHGLETYDPPAPPSEEKKGLEEYFRTYDSPLLLHAEQAILQDLSNRHIASSSDREKALVRALASTSITQDFENIYSTMWASQLTLLQFLNPRNGAEMAEVLPWYEGAKINFPQWYQAYPFEGWLGFLKQAELITESNSRLGITVKGREFLKYLIAMGKPGPHFG